MSGKFMNIKKIVVPILSLVIMLGSMVGCSVVKSDELLEMLNNGSTITIEVASPEYDTTVKGEESSFSWIQLDQLNTYNKGFRQGIDEVFNINIVTELGKNGKSGVLFVGEDGNRNGNAVLADALRNKVFNDKYWSDAKVKTALAELASEAYTDVSENETYNIVASMNAYFNLFVDNTNPDTFNFNQSLTRKDFYSGVYRSENGVSGAVKSSTDFDLSVGGHTDQNKFASQLVEYGFLPLENKSLDETSYNGTISRAEAVYLMVNKHFNEELKSVDSKSKAFSDTKNGGDLALKLKFKEKNKETKEITEKDRWEAYTLAYMMQNPDDGMQEELYKAMVVAKDKGLITSTESRWDEPMSKGEAVLLMVNTHMALNKSKGFASEIEYGEMAVGEIKEEVTEAGPPPVEDVDGMMKLDPNSRKEEFTPTYKELYDSAVHMFKYYKSTGLSDAEAFELIDEDARTMRVTLEELNNIEGYAKIGETKPVVTEPSKPITVKPNEPTPSKPSTSTPSKPSTPTPSKPSGEKLSKHGYPITDWDKDGNGITDDIESAYIETDGTNSNPEGTPNPFDMP